MMTRGVLLFLPIRPCQRGRKEKRRQPLCSRLGASPRVWTYKMGKGGAKGEGNAHRAAGEATRPVETLRWGETIKKDGGQPPPSRGCLPGGVPPSHSRPASKVLGWKKKLKRRQKTRARTPPPLARNHQKKLSLSLKLFAASAPPQERTRSLLLIRLSRTHSLTLSLGHCRFPPHNTSKKKPKKHAPTTHAQRRKKNLTPLPTTRTPPPAASRRNH